ncbi:MAG: tetratricopeptide repeat protein [Planctomycetes bacterium]|nr:tetratricopeptide repeat protein [Planctomycetota bacterium]
MYRALLLLLLLMTLAGCGGGNAEPGQEATNQPAAKDNTPGANIARSNELLAEGKARYDKSEFEKAITELTEAVEWNPDNARAWDLLGRCHYKLKHWRDCRDAFKNALRNADASVRQAQAGYVMESSTELGKQAMAIGQYKLAEEHARDALQWNRAYLPAVKLLAEALYQRGQFDDARTQFQALAEQNVGEDRHNGLYWAGLCSTQLRQYDKAEATFSTLIKEGYTAGDVYYWRAECRADRKDMEGAIQDVNLAIANAASPDRRKELEAVRAELEKRK